MLSFDLYNKLKGWLTDNKSPSAHDDRVKVQVENLVSVERVDEGRYIDTITLAPFSLEVGQEERLYFDLDCWEISVMVVADATHNITVDFNPRDGGNRLTGDYRERLIDNKALVSSRGITKKHAVNTPTFEIAIKNESAETHTYNCKMYVFFPARGEQ